MVTGEKKATSCPRGKSKVQHHFQQKEKVAINCLWNVTQWSYLIFVTIATTGDGVHFQVDVLFAQRTRNSPYFGQFGYFVANWRTYWCYFTTQMLVMKMAFKWSPISAPLWFGLVWQNTWHLKLWKNHIYLFWGEPFPFSWGTTTSRKTMPFIIYSFDILRPQFALYDKFTFFLSWARFSSL